MVIMSIEKFFNEINGILRSDIKFYNDIASYLYLQQAWMHLYFSILHRKLSFDFDAVQYNLTMVNSIQSESSGSICQTRHSLFNVPAQEASNQIQFEFHAENAYPWAGPISVSTVTSQREQNLSLNMA